MRTKIIKRASLVVLILVFTLTPRLNAGAITSDNDENEPWLRTTAVDGKGRIYCDEGTKALLSALCSNSAQTLSETTSNNLVTVTMHVNAGEGQFEGEADPLVHSKEFYFRDSFDDYTKPVSERNDYVFAGWSKSPEATSVDVIAGETRISNVGTDLYAVWSNKSYVYYHVINGFWENPVDGEAYSEIIMEYNSGSNFQSLTPTPRTVENVYNFVGWFERMSGQGKEYTSSTVIDGFITDVYSAWNYDATKIDRPMELDTEYDFTAGISVPVFTFTAPETAVYEVYTNGIVSGDTDEDSYQGMVRVRNIFDRSLAMEEQMNPESGWGDVHTYYEMQAGETYYIRVGEVSGKYLSAKVAIRKPTMVDVNFHANLPGESGAYFDGDPTKLIKTVAFPVGYDIRIKSIVGLNYDEENYQFATWQTENDDDHSYLIVTEDTTDLYASYVEMITVYLDYNGGYDPFTKAPSCTAKFIPGRSFEAPIDPSIDDPAISFVGWSRNQDATEPDGDIKEGGMDAGLLKNQTLYAVYGEKVPVTYVVNGGGYMVDDPNVTVYETSLGNGHIFYGMAVMHDNENVKHAGWIDQNGERIYETSHIDANYHIDGETTFTAVLNYQLTAFANGGLFPNGGIGGAEVIRAELPYEDEDSTFSLSDILARTGTPIIPDDNTKEFAGFATRADATEPNITDETPLVNLSYIYTVWKDKEEPTPSEDEDSEFNPNKDEESEASVVPNTGVNHSDTDSLTVIYSEAVVTILVLGLVSCYFIRKYHAKNQNLEFLSQPS